MCARCLGETNTQQRLVGSMSSAVVKVSVRSHAGKVLIVERTSMTDQASGLVQDLLLASRGQRNVAFSSLMDKVVYVFV